MEQWKPVAEFNGLYEVSNHGRVRSLRGKEPRIMKPALINSGYLKIGFHFGNKTTNRLVHRLVAREFCEGYAEGLVVNHKDADRLNNHADNLEWVTAQENIHDVMKRGKFDVKSAHRVAHEKRKRRVFQYTKDGKFITEFPSARLAAKAVGVHENCISRVARGERPYSAGYAWKYSN